MPDKRWRVIEYVRDKYGHDAVSQIATFGTMSSKAVIRDVGRVLDLPYNFCDQLSMLILLEANKPLFTAKAIEVEPQLKAKLEEEEEVRDLFDPAQRLEDLTRNVGMHAGGVLIAPGKLTDFCPLYSADVLVVWSSRNTTRMTSSGKLGYVVRLPWSAQPDDHQARQPTTSKPTATALISTARPFSTIPRPYQILMATPTRRRSSRLNRRA